MNILFIHQNFPGQFKYLAPELSKRNHNIVALAIGDKSYSTKIPGVKIYLYSPQRGTTPNIHPWVSDFETKTIRGQACFLACLKLKEDGFIPDLIISHPGWGESMFVKDVWPKVKLAIYCEFYYNPSSTDVGFDPEFPAKNIGEVCRLRLKNLNNIIHFQIADVGISPTKWQASTFPDPFRSKIKVIHDGINTSLAIPKYDVVLNLKITQSEGKSKKYSFSKNDEIITFVNRNLEPYRGYHTFMRSLPEVLARRPNAYVLIIGGDSVSYGAAPPKGDTWKNIYLSEIREKMSTEQLDRILFLGNTSYEVFLKVLQVSTVHVYLTYPFVLSWSLLEAMSTGCAIVASQTPPVMEVIENNESGRLFNFFDYDSLARHVINLIEDSDERERLGRQARLKVINSFSLTNCLSQQMNWVESLLK